MTNIQEATDAIRLVDESLEQLLSMRARLGSIQKNTLETHISVLRSSAVNLTSAESIIRDADIALEFANFTKNQIVTESAAAAVAQANQTVDRVLSLLFNNISHSHWQNISDH